MVTNGPMGPWPGDLQRSRVSVAQVLHDQESLLDFDARVTELAAPRDVKIDVDWSY